MCIQTYLYYCLRFLKYALNFTKQGRPLFGWVSYEFYTYELSQLFIIGRAPPEFEVISSLSRKHVYVRRQLPYGNALFDNILEKTFYYFTGYLFYIAWNQDKLIDFATILINQSVVNIFCLQLYLPRSLILIINKNKETEIQNRERCTHIRKPFWVP